MMEDDYLHIFVVLGPGNLWKESAINLPSWADFEFSLEGKVVITHSGKWILLKVPPGPPTWQLQMTRPNESNIVQKSDYITIDEKDKEPDEKDSFKYESLRNYLKDDDQKSFLMYGIYNQHKKGYISVLPGFYSNGSQNPSK